MTIREKLLLASFVFLIFPLPSVRAQFLPPEPQDYSKTKVSLMTVGRSSQLHARMGHSILRIQDFSNNYDYLANWGMFDFRDALFIPKFLRGGLMYRMAFSPFDRTISYYRDVERRSVIEDVLELTDRQKKILIEKIIWNAQPENLHYAYQFFRNNCATKPRDYLDLAMGGGLRTQLESYPASASYRDYVWDNMSSNLFVGWGLDVFFNGDTDVPLNRWQESFYPSKFRDHLRAIDQVDDAGRVLPGARFVKESSVLVDLPELQPGRFSGYDLTTLLTGIPIIGLLAIYVRSRRSSTIDHLVPAYSRVFGFVSFWWGATAGFFGLTHLLAWFFSSHTDLYRNVNILLFWPLDFILVVLGFRMLFLNKGFDSDGLFKVGFWRRFAQIHLVFIIGYIIIAYSGLSDLRPGRVMVYMVPLSLLYYKSMLLLIEGITKRD